MFTRKVYFLETIFFLLDEGGNIVILSKGNKKNTWLKQRKTITILTLSLPCQFEINNRGISLRKYHSCTIVFELKMVSRKTIYSKLPINNSSY